MRMVMKKINYTDLNAKQKENYNYHSSILTPLLASANCAEVTTESVPANVRKLVVPADCFTDIMFGGPSCSSLLVPSPPSSSPPSYPCFTLGSDPWSSQVASMSSESNADAGSPRRPRWDGCPSPDCLHDRNRGTASVSVGPGRKGRSRRRRAGPPAN